MNGSAHPTPTARNLSIRGRLNLAMTRLQEMSVLHRRIDESVLDFLKHLHDSHIPYSRDLLDELKRIVKAGGKRIRPRFLYWSHRAAGGPDSENLLKACASIELLHTFAIIHDDLVDGSSFRRGRPSSQNSFSLRANPAGYGVSRYGWGAALLAGDFALIAAEMCFTSSGFTTLDRARPIFDRMRLGAIAGEYRDIEASVFRNVDATEARLIAIAKSGRYSVVEPLLIGAALAGASGQYLTSLETFGLPLGEAFQLTDDILSVFGDPATTGKDQDTDLREGKQTLLIAALRQSCTPQQLEIVDSLLGSPNLSQTDAQILRDLIKSSGALNAAQSTVKALRNKARDALEQVEMPADAKVELQEMIWEVTDRVT